MRSFFCIAALLLRREARAISAGYLVQVCTGRSANADRLEGASASQVSSIQDVPFPFAQFFTIAVVAGRLPYLRQTRGAGDEVDSCGCFAHDRLANTSQAFRMHGDMRGTRRTRRLSIDP